jgi:1-acyl-sn-glycerol-3-phosphate acyltransferase
MTRTSHRSGLLGRSAGTFATGIEIDSPGRFSPGLVGLARRVLRPLNRVLFRARLEGLEKLPEQGPFLLVANHSAGAGLAEIGCFYAEYLARTRGERPLAGFALPLGFRLAPMARLLRAGGAIPSTFEAAEATLKDGVPILIFPGGDHETLRPIWQAHKVDFGGRTGFLRIAREHGVPIVPMGIRGSHFTAPMLWRSERLAHWLILPRLFGLKRWGISVLSVIGVIAIVALVPLPLLARLALAWFWLASPLVFLPWMPWRIRIRIGDPIPPEALFTDSEAEQSDFRATLRQVETAVQAQITGVRS